MLTLSNQPLFYWSKLSSFHQYEKGAMMDHTLDLTSTSEDKRFEKLGKALEAVKDEQELSVKSDEDLFPLLNRLQKLSAGELLWFPTQTAPNRWTAMILKTKGNPSLHKSLVAFLSYDHTRCDHFYAEMEASVHKGDADLSENLLQVFSLSMHRHLDVEEKVVFSAFEEQSEMTTEVTDVMRMEHGQMRGMMTEMMSALGANDTKAVLELGEALVLLRQQHNMKEESIIYPIIDSQMGSETADLIKKSQHFNLT